MSSPREREKRDRRDSRRDKREGQGRKRNRNESEETEEIKTFPLYPYPLQEIRKMSIFGQVYNGWKVDFHHVLVSGQVLYST